MSLRIWIIVGESDTGKSTLVGHLMGQFGKSDTGLKHNGANFCNVPQIGGGSMQFFSARCALQESPKGDGSPKDARRHLIEKWKNKPAHQSMNCLITLRLNQDEGHGTAYKYIDEFLKAGDEFMAGVGLAVGRSDQDKLMSYGVPFLFLPDRKKVNRTILEGAAAVRQHFHWA